MRCLLQLKIESETESFQGPRKCNVKDVHLAFNMPLLFTTPKPDSRYQNRGADTEGRGTLKGQGGAEGWGGGGL